jgi:hypothetical protein
MIAIQCKDYVRFILSYSLLNSSTEVALITSLGREFQRPAARFVRKEYLGGKE